MSEIHTIYTHLMICFFVSVLKNLAKECDMDEDIMLFKKIVDLLLDPTHTYISFSTDQKSRVMMKKQAFGVRDQVAMISSVKHVS